MAKSKPKLANGLGEGKVTKALGGPPGVSKAVDLVGEGVENALGTAIDPFLKRATYNKNAQPATPKGIGQSALMGMATSTAFQLPSVVDDIAAQYTKGLNSIRQKMTMDNLAAVYEKNVGNLSKFSDENTYADWLHSIGADETQLNSLAKYNEAKYNNFPEYKVLSQYAKDVESGWISPLSGFENYKTLNQQVQDEVIGGTAANGTLINGQVPHFMQRVIGTTVDPKILKENLQVIRRSGVEIEDIKDAVFSPEKIGDVTVRKSGQRSVKFVGRKCAVTINPDTGELIQTNPLGD